MKSHRAVSSQGFQNRSVDSDCWTRREHLNFDLYINHWDPKGSEQSDPNKRLQRAYFTLPETDSLGDEEDSRPYLHFVEEVDSDVGFRDSAAMFYLFIFFIIIIGVAVSDDRALISTSR